MLLEADVSNSHTKYSYVEHFPLDVHFSYDLKPLRFFGHTTNLLFISMLIVAIVKHDCFQSGTSHIYIWQ